jgi:dienelactone hydrolase
MAEVLLFHHAHGLTRGVHGLAGAIAEAGHAVHVPDLYDGRVFDDLEQGVAHAQEVGFGTILDRARAAADALPTGLVYAGLSLGVLPAQMLAQTRAGASGALLLHGCLTVSEFGERWPPSVPVQIHAMDADPFFVGDGDLEAARALLGSGAPAELFLYPGTGHLFCDSSLPGYDQQPATLLTERLLRFLDGVASLSSRGSSGP